MKTNLEILEMLKELIETSDPVFSKYLQFGLCNILGYMIRQKLICHIEEARILHYMKLHRPENTKNKVYWYHVGDMIPRLAWINEHIELLSSKESLNNFSCSIK